MAYSSISKPSLYFNTKLYTGTGSSNALTGVGFQPGLTWIKQRNESRNHAWFDAVRGVTKLISSSSNGAQSTQSNGLTAFGADGFTVVSHDDVNKSSATYASWNWLAGGAASSNTDGSITSSVSANTTAGFSIVTYTGTGSNATIGHGLNAVPKMYIARNITDNEQWTTYHVELDNSAPEDYHVRLNTNDARVNEASVWNDTAPTSSVFSVGSSGAPNGPGDTHIAYCFAEKKGYSKIGKYSGNGNADGTFVYTGFKPALIIIKDRDNAGENWFIFDNKRPGHNFNANLLNPNSTTTETTSGANGIDILSNGFKMRSTNNGTNRSGGDGFMYMAIAEEPLVANVGAGIPTTAR